MAAAAMSGLVRRRFHLGVFKARREDSTLLCATTTSISLRHVDADPPPRGRQRDRPPRPARESDDAERFQSVVIARAISAVIARSPPRARGTTVRRRAIRRETTGGRKTASDSRERRANKYTTHPPATAIARSRRQTSRPQHLDPNTSTPTPRWSDGRRRDAHAATRRGGRATPAARVVGVVAAEQPIPAPAPAVARSI